MNTIGFQSTVVNLARAQDEGLQFWQTRWNRMHLQGDFSKWRTSFIRAARYASTSTKSCTQKFLANAAAATAAARHFWECIRSQLETVCKKIGEGRDEKIQATQQRSQKPPAAGNCCGVMCQTSLMLKKSLNFKSASELILKDEE